MRDRADYTSYLMENPSKVEIIHGQLDNLIPTKTLQSKCEGWKNIALIENSGHMSNFEAPKKVIELLNQLTTITR